MPTIKQCECGYWAKPLGDFKFQSSLCPRCGERTVILLSTEERLGFSEIDRQMPMLVTHLCADLRTTAFNDIREFEVLDDKSQTPVSPLRLVYFKSDYDDLASKLDALVSAGYLTPIDTPNAYRMSENFVACVLAFG